MDVAWRFILAKVRDPDDLDRECTEAIDGKSRSMERGVPRRRRPRPVVSAGLESLLSRSEELAKGWLLALIEDAPLEAAAAIVAGDVARDGPRICDALVRAIYDEADLRRIEHDGALEPLASRVGELAGAGDVVAAAHAVETLKDVVWGALRRELGPDDPELLVEAAERLSLVTELVRSAVLRHGVAGDGAVDRPERRAPLHVAADPPDRGRVPLERRGVPGLDDTPGSIGVADGAAHGGSFEAGRAGNGEQTRREAGREALWVGALRDEIVRAGRARVPLSLLLVELEEAEKMLATEPHAAVSATFGRFAQAVRGSVRRRDVLACETESRAWIIARDTGRAGAQALGSRIAVTVPGQGSWRGAPLTVSVGLAVLGEDGCNASTLIEAAEQTRFAAEASGIGMVWSEFEDGDGEPPSTEGPGLAS
jgi:GGDEF domain-containing protein